MKFSDARCKPCRAGTRGVVDVLAFMNRTPAVRLAALRQSRLDMGDPESEDYGV